MNLLQLQDQDLFFAILDRCPIGIAVIAYDGTYLAINPAYHALYGYDRDEMIGGNFLMVFPPEDRERVLARHQNFLDRDGKLGGEWRVRRRDGSEIVVLSESVRFVQPGKPAARLVYVLDISARKTAEEGMQIAATVYETSREGILVTDADNRIIAANPAFTRLTGYELDEVRGKDPAIFKSDRHDRAFYQEIWRSLRRQGHWVGEIWDRRKTGEEYVKQLSISVVKDAHGKVFRHVAIFSDITERKITEEMIWRQANYDDLTHLPNRAMFRDRLLQNAAKARRGGGRMALILIDLDRFKAVNDSLGHSVGDELLKAAGARIVASVRDVDTTARLGGDEFAVIVSDLRSVEDADRIAVTLVNELAQPFELDGETVFVSASVGIAIFPDDADSLEALFNCADQAMYAAKGEGRNRFSYHTPELQEALRHRLRLSADLRAAVAGQQFMAYYQPIVDLADGRVVKAEALVRWRHPTRGIVSPAEFIPIAEENGLIVPIGDFVAQDAVARVAGWRAQGHPDFQVSINQSPVQLRHSRKGSDGLAQALAARGLAGNAVVIEITEGLLLNAEATVAENLRALRGAGVEVAIDDFGTGYSSLSYLQKFDVDFLKIDRSFVDDLKGSGADLCEAIVVMAHRLGVKVVAEGVEEAWQRDLLAAMGCDYAQGYLYSPPLPPDAFEARWLRGVE